MIPRLLRKLLSVEFLGPILVIFALQMLTYGISSSLPGTNISLLFAVCLFAASLGWLLSRSRLNGFYASLLIAAAGLVGIWIVGARLFTPLWDWVQAITALFPQIIPALREKFPLDLTQTREAWSVVAQASSALWTRWQFWLRDIGNNNPVNDALVRNMIWSFILWCFAAWTGWFAARRNAILALLPGILLMALILSYSEYRIYSLWMMVILMLLLMGIWNYKNHTTQWEQRRVDYSDSILYDNAQAVVFLALLVGTVAFTVPSISWRAIRDALQNRNQNEAAEVLGIRKQTVTQKDPIFQKPSMPREHILSQGFEQSQELVMTVRTGELSPVPNPSLAVDAPRHYWRGMIYDLYQGTGWITSATTPQHYRANSPLIPGLLDHYSPLHLDVKMQRPEGRLFWSGLLYSASVPFRADWRLRPKSDLFADQAALLQSDLFTAASGSDSYEAETYIPQVTIQELRAASTEYPEYIHARYLQLPYLPPRVHELANEITAGIENPYDKAKAIESYLRSAYPYDLDIPAPPEDQDVTDYFLFDLKRGYCDYYATAMVVLARASGLPARFVSGYSSGSYDALNAEYVVRELNAHSWAEIYFPGIGWIEFEPTAYQPVIVRPEKEAEIPAVVNRPATQTSKFLFTLTNTGVLYWISALILIVLLIVFYFAVLERFWILRRKPANAVAVLFQRYYRVGRPLAGARTQAETASEFTSRLIHTVDTLDARFKRTEQLKTLRENARELTSLYLLSLFSDHRIDRQDASKAFILWRRLRLQLWTARLQRYLSNQRDRISSMRAKQY